MSTSTSDHDFSDSASSPMFVGYSPNSSPSQQVPQLTNGLHELTCIDKQLHRKTPYLRIIEQPPDHFRFRYASEMVGTHGCLLGKNSGVRKEKSHPSVELMNYPGRAMIKCSLVQIDKNEEHPHKLLEEEQDRELCYLLPVDSSYKVAFGGIGIIHTAKKDVPALLFKKLSEKMKNMNVNLADLRTRCDQMAKSMNLNIVRLKFSAHDVNSGKELCEPVFSEPIHNLKSAQTNDLKICRISCTSGKASGGDDVFILVEKVNKKNIMVRFFELDDNGQRCWSGVAQFMQSDVHHQYAIVCRTPAYKNPDITHDVQVYMELVRPQDGRTSEPKEFIYKKNKIRSQFKKRKLGSSLCSIGSSSSGSILSESDIPVTIDQMKMSPESVLHSVPMEPHQVPYNVMLQARQRNDCDLASALYSAPGSEATRTSPMWGAPCLPPEHTHDIQLNSAELNEISNMLENEEDVLQYFNDIAKSHGETIPKEMNSMEFIRSLLVADSGRGKKAQMDQKDNAKPIDIKKENGEYTAFYKSKDGLEVQKIVKYFCEMRNKRVQKPDIRENLERLFEKRLSNGDTFLHMTMCTNPSSLDYILKWITIAKATHLLDLVNDKQQTVLHLAVMLDLRKVVSSLIAKGANPMLKDEDGLNAIHYAVKYDSCLDVLLESIRKHDVPCDLNEYNREKQTALHMAVVCGRGASVTSLLSRGAARTARDALGRTPLHLAAYDARLHVTRALLHFTPPSEIDETDSAGNTALQIVCGAALKEHSMDIAVLLLEKKANPILKTEDSCNSAWRLVKDKPELREVLRKYVMAEYLEEEDIKSEPEDEFESADEGEAPEEVVSSAAAWWDCVCARLEAGGAWRALATRLGLAVLLSWCEAQPSPARTLLTYHKDTGEAITSRSLALILDDMGETETAAIIRQYID